VNDLFLPAALLLGIVSGATAGASDLASAAG